MVVYTCEKCDQMFDRKADYTRHLNNKTGCSKKRGSKMNKKPLIHICAHCDKIYNRKDQGNK